MIKLSACFFFVFFLPCRSEREEKLTRELDQAR